MSYDPEIKKYLESLGYKDFRLDLEPMRLACQLLNNPQETFASVHIVGTNGKGSTAAFLNALLQSCGYQTGLMTSPHLIDFRERIQVNRRCVSWEALTEMVRGVREVLPSDDFLSYFEMMTLVGFEYFSKIGVDVAVVEAGMGGRFDATNVLKPGIVVITPISLDHESYLGSTIAKIAGEKCGVLKPDMVVISAPQTEEAAQIIEKACKSKGLELIWADPQTIQTDLGLAGRHQKINAACAVAAAKALVSASLVEQIYENALKNTRWPGRLEYVSQNPQVLVDGAHNPQGIQTLVDYLKEFHPKEKIHLMLGVLADKNWREMFAPLLPLASRLYCVSPPTSRALRAKEIAAHFESFGKPMDVLSCSIAEALHSILPRLAEGDLLVATGSLYVVGEVCSWFVVRDSCRRFTIHDSRATIHEPR